MQKTKKRFSIKLKLLIIFGLLVSVSIFILGLLAVRIARKAVTEKVETHLTDKATDTAEIVDGRINAFIQFLEGIGRNPILQDQSLSFTQKARALEKEAQQNALIEFFGVCDLNGTRYAADGSTTSIGDRDWYKSAVQGKNFMAEPRVSRATDALQIITGVPIYDDNRKVIGVLSAATNAQKLSDLIDDIIVGKTGECYILGIKGTAIAHKNFDNVVEQLNM
uniref:cache domain-containing protein n=1 Tax=Treponema pedis TaxID=409322 RepID=UPI00056EC2B2